MLDNSNYSKEKAKLFLKYLVNASSRLERQQKRLSRIYPEHMPIVRIVKSPENPPSGTERKIPQEYSVREIGSERKRMLESKINMFFSGDKYSMFESRLRAIRGKLSQLRKTKKYKKSDIDRVALRIRECERLLRKIKKREPKNYSTD